MKKIKFMALLLGIALFASTPSHSQQASKKQGESPALTATTQYANIENKKIGYRKFGKGVPIFLANRFRGTLDTWDPLFLDLFAQQNTVIIFDYAGIGYSEGEFATDIKDVAAEVTRLADYLKIDKFNVAGFSYGGWVAQYVTFLNTSRVLKTVIISNNPMGKNEFSFEQVFLQSAMKLNKDLTFEDYLILFFDPQSETSRAAAQKSSERISKRLDGTKVPQSPEILQRYLAPVAAIAEDKENFRGAYETLKTPVLAISCDHDIAFPVENWFPMVKKAATLQIIVMPEAGHAPQDQYPEITTGYINSFLKN
jgi:pimeloyl-ACP methyl ester carboxylesterase